MGISPAIQTIVIVRCTIYRKGHRQEFLAAGSITKAGEVVAKALVERVMASLSGISDSSKVDIGRPMHDFGVNSLMAIELRTWFSEAFAANAPIFEILGEGALDALKSELKKCKAAEGL